MFLRSQHFQQQQRHIEAHAHACSSALQGYFWGFTELELDGDAGVRGVVALRKATGMLPDGTPFTLPEGGLPPPSLEVPGAARDVNICLVLPPQREDAETIGFDDDAAAARFVARTVVIHDENEGGAEPAEIQVAQVRLTLMLESEVPHGWLSLRVARVVERKPSNALLFDDAFIPPFLSCVDNPSLVSHVREVSGLLHQRGEALAARMSASGQKQISEVGDFLVLNLVNRWQPYFLHLETLPKLHPERLYADLLKLVGELATYANASRRPPKPPQYRHDDLETSFTPLLFELRQALSMVLEQSVLRIELQERKYGIRIAVLPDRELLKQASFVLAVQASLPAEQVQAQFPAQVKIGPVEKIRDLINLHLPGVVLRPLPVAPRALPYHAGHNYFELDTQHELWKELERSAGLALHVAGDFPQLELECWAIRK